MLPRRSPPKHRHDGTSPLPLGMDWSPPPKKWNGRDTIWPHDPRTGWSYCVTIPSWVFQPEPGSSDDSMINPIVFFTVQVGLQSPEGIATARGILKRFSDFLKLFSELKKAFPRKSMPQPPPKHALLRINSSRLLLEERRYALEEWMGKVLSDIDLSRSVQVASFLELESAARSAFQDVSQNGLESNLACNNQVKSSFQTQTRYGAIATSSLSASASASVASDCGSDSAYENSEAEIPEHAHNNSESNFKLVKNFSSPMRSSPTHGLYTSENNTVVSESYSGMPEDFLSRMQGTQKLDDGNDVKEPFPLVDREDLVPDVENDKRLFHVRKVSSESVGSDMSSVRGSELSVPGISFPDLSERETVVNMDTTRNMDIQALNDAQVILPLDQRHKLNRILLAMQRRLVTAKTDMEDLISRLNQETTVKDYLATKVKDLEVELESTIQRGKENLHQAIMSERERVTQMQWDMDELRRKTLELESKLKFEQNERNHADSQKTSAVVEKETLMQELDVKEQQLVTLKKRVGDLEQKSKSDVKVLSKEVRSLRNSQAELKEKLNQSLKEKSELERVLQKERQRWGQSKVARKNLLHECGLLRDRLQECSVNFLAEDKFTVDSSSLSDALDLLATSDNRIGLLLAEAQLLAQEDENSDMEVGSSRRRELPGVITVVNGDDPCATDDEVRKMLTDIFIDNAGLRKQVNSVMRCALETVYKSKKEDEDGIPRKTVLEKLLERDHCK